MNLFKKKIVIYLFIFINIFSENFKLKKHLNNLKEIILNNKKSSIGTSIALLSLITGLSAKKYFEKKENKKKSLDNLNKQSNDQILDIDIFKQINEYLKYDNIKTNDLNFNKKIQELNKQINEKFEKQLNDNNTIGAYEIFLKELESFAKKIEENQEIKKNKTIIFEDNHPYIPFSEYEKLYRNITNTIKAIENIKNIQYEENKIFNEFSEYIKSIKYFEISKYLIKLKDNNINFNNKNISFNRFSAEYTKIRKALIEKELVKALIMKIKDTLNLIDINELEKIKTNLQKVYNNENELIKKINNFLDNKITEKAKIIVNNYLDNNDKFINEEQQIIDKNNEEKLKKEQEQSKNKEKETFDNLINIIKLLTLNGINNIENNMYYFDKYKKITNIEYKKQIEVKLKKQKNLKEQEEIEKQKELIEQEEKKIAYNNDIKEIQQKLQEQQEQKEQIKMKIRIDSFIKEYNNLEIKDEEENIKFLNKISNFIKANTDFVDINGTLIPKLKELFKIIQKNQEIIKNFKQNFEILMKTNNFKKGEDLFINFKQNNPNFLNQKEITEFDKIIKDLKNKKNDKNFKKEGFINRLFLQLEKENKNLEFFKKENDKKENEKNKKDDFKKDESYLNDFFNIIDSFSSYFPNFFKEAEQKNQQQQDQQYQEIEDDFEIVENKNTNFDSILKEFKENYKNDSTNLIFILETINKLNLKTFDIDEKYKLITNDKEKELIDNLLKVKILNKFEETLNYFKNINFDENQIKNNENYKNINKLINQYNLQDVKYYIGEKLKKENIILNIEQEIQKQVNVLKNSGIKNKSAIKNTSQIKNQQNQNQNQNQKIDQDQELKNNIDNNSIEQKMKNFSDEIFAETSINIYDIYKKLIKLSEEVQFNDKFKRAEPENQNYFFNKLDEIVFNAGIQKDGRSAEKLEKYFIYLSKIAEMQYVEKDFNKKYKANLKDNKNNQDEWAKNHKIMFKKIELEEEESVIITTDIHSSLYSLLDCIKSFINKESKGLIISGDYVHRDLHKSGTQSMLCLLMSSFMSVFGLKEDLNIVLTRGNHETGDCGNPPPENIEYYSQKLLNNNYTNYLKSIFPLQSLIFINQKLKNNEFKENLFIVQHSLGTSEKEEKFKLNEIENQLKEKSTITTNVNIIIKNLDLSFQSQKTAPDMWCNFSQTKNAMINVGGGYRGVFTLNELDRILKLNYEDLYNEYKTITGHEHDIETFKQIYECQKGYLVGFNNNGFKYFKPEDFKENKNMFNVFHYDNNLYGHVLLNQLNKKIKQIVSIFKNGEMKSCFIDGNGLKEIEEIQQQNQE